MASRCRLSVWFLSAGHRRQGHGWSLPERAAPWSGCGGMVMSPARRIMEAYRWQRRLGHALVAGTGCRLADQGRRAALPSRCAKWRPGGVWLLRGCAWRRRDDRGSVHLAVSAPPGPCHRCDRGFHGPVDRRWLRRGFSGGVCRRRAQTPLCPPGVPPGHADACLDAAVRRWRLMRQACGRRRGHGWKRVRPASMPQYSAPPSGTARSGLISITSPLASGTPRVSTSLIIGPIWRGGKLTTASTWRPTSSSGW